MIQIARARATAQQLEQMNEDAKKDNLRFVFTLPVYSEVTDSLSVDHLSRS